MSVDNENSHRKHAIVEEWVRNALRDGLLAPGDMLPSEKELCEKFSIGRSSVRNALGNLARAGVLETRKGIGSFLLTPGANATMNIGVVCFRSDSYIFPRIIHGCSRVLSRNGYHLLLNETHNELLRERQVLEALQKKGVDGIMIEPFCDGSGVSNSSLLETLEQADIPVVLLDNRLPQTTFDSVVLDDAGAGRMAAAYLYERGHRRIGIAYSPIYAPKVLRRDSTIAYLREHGVTVPAEWLLGYEGELAAGGLRAMAARVLTRSGSRPTAFVCTNDAESIEVIKAAGDAGLRYPQELSIVSFDNSDLASLPGIELTSVNHPGAFMGDLAATLLIERIRYHGVSSRTNSVVQPVIVERSSVTEVEP